MRKINIILITLSILGFIDALYLTIKHYSNEIVPCTNNIFIDCGQVLDSPYSMLFNIPVALFGMIHYLIILILLILILKTSNILFKNLFIIEIFNGFLFSLYLVYLQITVIHAICLYCMLSAIISFTLFFICNKFFSYERKKILIYIIFVCYKFILKPIFFIINPEVIHEFIIKTGNLLGKNKLIKKIIKNNISIENEKLKQKISGITFENPIGLAAGFDYDADLTSFLPVLGFGFMSVGTVTNMPYQGNPKPRLGRLPKSRSLMVNKGFKSKGSLAVSKKLRLSKFDIPVGISIGRTNNKNINTLEKSVTDIIRCFKTFEKSSVKNSYYELNISCPNLINAGDINFYDVVNLEKLLQAIDNLKIKKPVFVKMPIDKTDGETINMLEIIKKHNITGIIFGNLQKNRNHPKINKNEVKKFNTGNFSGKPTYDRSNELIELSYKKYKDRFVIIGCGGVFDAKDAHEKIIRGASLVQLITGLIYEGPQLISQINHSLSEILEEKKLKNISDLIGDKYR